MIVADMKKIMATAPSQIQPWVKAEAIDYIESCQELNPISIKSNALFSQFTTGKGESANLELIADASTNFVFECIPSEPKAYFYGTSLLRQTIPLKPNTTYFIVKPYSLFGVKGWKMPPTECRDQHTLLNNLLETNDIEYKIIQASTFQNRIDLFKEHYIDNWLDVDYSVCFEEYLAIILYMNHLTITMDEIAELSGYSKRYCRKRFTSEYGISPQKYIKIFRFQNTLRMLLDRRFKRSLIQISNENGYFDEAHFIKDFKAYMGLSPDSFKNKYASLVEKEN
ncbi:MULTISPECIES: helix-turn-helix domain-containing protein [unclassified Sedimentibacter]|uniref:helix-turn-helix domain-containing protein n=1 Tax=unclassified Sedimentibacter TaxID=2649220 RepID=UPI0027DF0850|nr:helix-turn-helix transcriptional regulator [Sedimentibacter sp. MB35-C1]WMJ78536.1 helix-turn-helix transcriptional regulator [Sedimentibacter sp. MB35-C1]